MAGNEGIRAKIEGFLKGFGISAAAGNKSDMMDGLSIMAHLVVTQRG